MALAAPGRVRATHGGRACGSTEDGLHLHAEAGAGPCVARRRPARRKMREGGRGVEDAVIVRGRMTDARHIELDEPLEEVLDPVEVVLRSVPVPEESEDIVDFLARIPAGTRSKEDIDRQIRGERDSWDRPWDGRP